MAGKQSTSVIADLDTVVAPNIHVQLNGKKYPLPGDAPSELLLRLTLTSEELEKAVESKDAERMLELREEISTDAEELFRLRNPTLAEGEINLSDAQLGELIAKLFKHYYGAAVEDAEREEAERPTEAPEAEEEQAATTPSSESAKSSPPSSSRTPARRRRRSRSSASSPT